MKKVKKINNISNMNSSVISKTIKFNLFKNIIK